MSEMSEKAIKLIKDLRRDIWEKNVEDYSLKALVDYIAELEAAPEVAGGAGMSEMKPCPFCGEQVFPPLASSLDDGYTRCGLCGAKMQHRRWQTRPIEDALRKRIAELEAQLEERIDQFITHYNDAVSAGKVSVDVKRELTDAEIEELGAQEAERKEFCPNCEAETPCTHEAELFVCDICGEDFAKYIVLRNCTLPDVSTTQDVTTPEPPEGA